VQAGDTGLAGDTVQAGDTGLAGDTVQAQEWWLGGLHVTQAWRSTQGAGITVAVLGTGVDTRHLDLAGSVTTGPDLSGSGRTAGGPFWGVNGTEVAGVIAGHGHGTGHTDGILGVAPAAKILSIRVTLEFNDPLNADKALGRKLPGAIAAGITYAVDHGARIIELPMDPGTGGVTGQGNPAAAGGSQAEQAAVANALSKDVILIAPAGDDGAGAGLVDYPAAYPGVIAVGAVARDGLVASFSSRRAFVTLTAPGVSLTAATPSGAYAPISSTSMSSGIVSGVAALILSRFPHLTGAQVSQVLAESVTPARANTPGAGLGTIDAARAVSLAAGLSRTSQSAAAAAAPIPSHQPERLSTTVARQASASSLASSLVRYAVAGLGVLIALLVVLLLVMRSRREKVRAAAEAASSRARPRGLHEHRKPELASGMAIAGLGGVSRAQAPHVALGSSGVSGTRPAPPAPPASWTATGGFTGGGLGEMQSSASGPHAPGAPFRPAMTPAPKAAKEPADGDPGPPWAPAAEPGRTFGSLPVGANSALPPDPGPGIRVPGDMADLPAVPADAMLPAPFKFGTSPDPDFPPRPLARLGDDFPDVPARVQLPTRQSLGFAAAPVPLDHAPPQAPDFTVPSRAAGLVLSAGSANAGSAGAAGTGAVPAAPADSRAPRAAEPGFIWDLSGTDVFPAAAYPGEPEAPGAVPQDDDPGASAS
ncbi:MAG TPA: S8 family serine peptidase, partial [Streptosporangiaceae bacterium]|nr:S8 family serine peptidase [Streptosporangiaceae bacterium]